MEERTKREIKAAFAIIGMLLVVDLIIVVVANYAF